MGVDWSRLTEAYSATRMFRRLAFGDTSGAGAGGLDGHYAAENVKGIGPEIMGAAIWSHRSFSVEGLGCMTGCKDWKSPTT